MERLKGWSGYRRHQPQTPKALLGPGSLEFGTTPSRKMPSAKMTWRCHHSPTHRKRTPSLKYPDAASFPWTPSAPLADHQQEGPNFQVPRLTLLPNHSDLRHQHLRVPQRPVSGQEVQTVKHGDRGNFRKHLGAALQLGRRVRPQSTSYAHVTEAPASRGRALGILLPQHRTRTPYSRLPALVQNLCQALF